MRHFKKSLLTSLAFCTLFADRAGADSIPVEILDPNLQVTVLLFEQVGGTGGSLFRFELSNNRKRVDVSDPKLADRVADNLAKFEGTESESLIVGKGFGTTTDIEQGPDGNLYVVSITDGAIYKISRKQ